MISSMRLSACVMLAFCGLFLGCGRTADTPKPDAASRGTICVSLLALDNPFFKVIGDAIAA